MLLDTAGGILMLSLAKALRRLTALGLGLGLTAGAAAAQGTPDQPSTDPVSPTDPTTPIDPVNTPPVPPPVVTDPVVVDPPTTTTTTTTYTPVYTEPTYVESSDEPFLERYGVAFVLGGGVEGFTNDSMRSSTNDGGNWDARAIFGTRDWVGFEAAYIGSAQSINALGLDNDALLVGNGVQANLRLNLTKDAIVQPFAFAGAAWRRYTLQNEGVNTSAVRSEDDVLEIPMGVGLAYKYEGFMIDARGEFRPATGEDLMPSLTDVEGDNTRAEMHRWGVNANIGYAF
jgi:hypothetical protein